MIISLLNPVASLAAYDVHGLQCDSYYNLDFQDLSKLYKFGNQILENLLNITTVKKQCKHVDRISDQWSLQVDKSWRAVFI